MNNSFLVEWFDLGCGLVILSSLTSIAFSPKLRENVIVLTTVAAGLLLLAYFIPKYSLKYRIEYLKETTDSDSTQFMAETVITYGFWWFFIALIIVIFFLTVSFLNRRRSLQN